MTAGQFWDHGSAQHVEIPDDLDAAISSAVDDLREASTVADQLMTIGSGDDTPATGSETTALVVADPDALAVKRQMGERRAQIVKARSAVAAASARVKLLAEMKKGELEKLTQEMAAIVGPLQEQVKLLEEGIWTITLYTGRNEDIVVLGDGERAGAEEPIAVRQTVLFMDEESLVAVEEGGIDFRSIEEFDEWLMADPAHLEQVLPDRKGVVVLEPRRTTFKTYEDLNQQMAAEAANSESYWLIRNGDFVCRMTTNMRVGHNLVPTPTEFTSFFQTRRYDHQLREYVTEPIQPGSSEWLKAEKDAGARQRHFMRIALVMQGLVDRSTVFHPLPTEGISFLEPASYDTGHINVVVEPEFALGCGREPFRDWLRGLNEQLRPGMRVIGAFGSAYARQSSGGGGGGRDESRVRPAGASWPVDLVLHQLEARTADGGLKFLYERTDKRHGYRDWDEMNRTHYGPWGQWPYKTRASYEVFASDSWVLPFDLVTVEELEWYMAARSQRHDYLALMPLMRAAIAAKHLEADAEEPMRQMLAGVLARENGVTVVEAAEEVPDLVDWFKLANRWHRPLVTDDAEDVAKACRMIVAEHAARLGAEIDHEAEAAMVTKLQLAHPDAVLIARQRDGYYLTFTREKPDAPWVAEHRTSPSGRSTRTDRWQLIGVRWRKWRILHAGAAWDGWDQYASPRDMLTDPERDGLVDELLDRFSTWSRSNHSGPETSYRLLRVRLDHTRYWGGEARPRFELDVVAEPVSAVIAPNLLSQKSTGPEVGRVTVKWQRDRRTGAVGFEDRSREPRVEQARGSQHDSEVLWEDLPLINLVAAERARLDDAMSKAEVMRESARRGAASIASQWNEFALACAYAVFLEDYLDPELWEGHRKTIKIPTYPHNGRYDSPSPVYAMLASLIEHGLDPHGLTVEQAVVLHRAHVEPTVTVGGWGPRVDGVAGWDSTLETVVDLCDDMPADVMTMTISTAIEPNARA